MSYEIGKCTKCGFHFAASLPESIDYQIYYNSFSKYDYEKDLSQIDSARINEVVKILEPIVSKNTRILDIGCGAGAMLATLRDHGWLHGQGLDPSPKSKVLSKKLFGLESVHLGTLKTVDKNLDLKNFDLICLMAVIEHLPDLRTDMENLVSKMRLGTKILLEVPAVEGFCGKNAEPFGEFSIEHINYFTIASLRNLATQLGLKIIFEHRLDLHFIKSSCLFIVAEKTETIEKSLLSVEDSQLFDNYISDSSKSFHHAVNKIPDYPFFLYGAGSHSARLIPTLDTESTNLIRGIVDANPNLVGEYFGQWIVRPVSYIKSRPEIPIVISSYRSQRAILMQLKQRYDNDLIVLYPD